MRKLLLLGLVVLSVFYPLVVYFGLQHLSPALFSVVFVGAAVLRLLSAERSPLQLMTFVAIAAYSGAVAFSNSQTLVLLYPVFMSWCVAFVFASSLLGSHNLIETIAQKRGQVITPNAKRYTYRLTQVWAVVLSLNGVIALVLALSGNMALWALYCGLLSYFVIGVLFAGEWFYRRHYIRRHGA